MGRRAAAALVVGAVAALAAGCGAGSARPAPAVGGDAQVIEVRATEFGFAPDTIRVASGQSVRLLLANAGQIEHDVRVDRIPAASVRASQGGHGHAGEVAAHAAKGKQAWVEFTPTTPGTYDLTCTIAGHKEAGMKGTLVVS